ncbi:MAG TPA: SDR family NAD(P)-dependent oxidoreductase [Candidatus Binatia bacterium]|jgi:NAD(P)-dependent dehydrogenase (short-subunit alcohol dehydrogenase family)
MAEVGEHKGRVAVITGGSGAIGAAIAERLKNAGAVVHVLDVQPSSVPGADFHRVDVRNETDVDAAFDAIGKADHRIDYLVCCAGIYRPAPFLNLLPEQWQETLQTNLTGYFLCCRAALRFMRTQKFGRIVMFSSMIARTGAADAAHYAASKGGVLGLARSLAVESAAENIRVNTISPTITDTPMPRAVLSEQEVESRKARIPLGRIGVVDDMAEACIFLLRDDSSYVLGQDLRVNGGSTLW